MTFEFMKFYKFTNSQLLHLTRLFEAYLKKNGKRIKLDEMVEGEWTVAKG